MADDEWRAIVKGVTRVKATLDAVDRRVDLATRAGLKACQGIAKRSIKGQIKGRPRWDHRGKSSRTGEAVDLHLFPHHEPRSGPPGILTGTLKRGVGGVKRPKKIGPEYHGGVGVGGGVRNLYKVRTNAKYPFIEPGMKKASPKFPAVWHKAWSRAINK